MLDFETVSAMSREILRNHDRHMARSRRELVPNAVRLGQVARRLAALSFRVVLVLTRIARRPG